MIYFKKGFSLNSALLSAWNFKHKAVCVRLIMDPWIISLHISWLLTRLITKSFGLFLELYLSVKAEETWCTWLGSSWRFSIVRALLFLSCPSFSCSNTWTMAVARILQEPVSASPDSCHDVPKLAPMEPRNMLPGKRLFSMLSKWLKHSRTYVYNVFLEKIASQCANCKSTIHLF